MEKKFLVGIVLLIVAIVVMFNIVGNMSTNLTGGAESITDANNCSEGKDEDGITLTYNITDKYCYNTTADSGKKYEAKQYNLPLNTLFAANGVVLLILMAAIFVFMIVMLLGYLKKEK